MDTKAKLNDYIITISGYKLEDKDARIEFEAKMGEIADFIETSDIPADASGRIVENIKNQLTESKNNSFDLAYYQHDIARQLAAVIRRWENHDEANTAAQTT